MKQNEIEKLALNYCETYGMTEFKTVGKYLKYYSYFGSEGFYKISINLLTKTQTRKRLKYTVNEFKKIHGEGSYNYFCG